MHDRETKNISDNNRRVTSMSDPTLRMTEPGVPPTQEQIKSWMGERSYALWTQISSLIAERYPSVFAPEWLFGGKKYGWSLRYKKSKSFCTLIPEKNSLGLLIVFGADERAKVETIRQELSESILNAYDAATTYHDGKWLFLGITDEAMLSDVARLLAVKRKPGGARGR